MRDSPCPSARQRLGGVVILAAAILTSTAGCAPSHYSVAVALSRSHVTYAQRHHMNKNDYLVDCRVDEQGQRSDCHLVELKGE